MVLPVVSTSSHSRTRMPSSDTGAAENCSTFLWRSAAERVCCVLPVPLSCSMYLKKAEQALAEYEQKLGLVKTLQRSEAVIGRIDEKIDALIAEFAETSSDLTAKLEEIKQIINTLEA